MSASSGPSDVDTKNSAIILCESEASIQCIDEKHVKCDSDELAKSPMGAINGASDTTNPGDSNTCGDTGQDSAKSDSAESTTVPDPTSEPTKPSQSTPVQIAADCKSAPEQAAENINPYAYTARSEFTSENFKIEIRNMPRYYGIGQLKKFLTGTLQLNVHKMKPLPGRNAGVFVTLRDEESRQQALKALDGCKWKKAQLTARPAAAVPDPLLAQRQKRRREDEAAGGQPAKRPCEEVSLAQRTRDAVVPWWNVPYATQLERKAEHVRDVFSSYRRELRKLNFPLARWLEKNAAAIDDVRPSPDTKQYRNKCEFSVGFHPETGERVVGFRLASYVKGSMAVAPLDELPHVPDRMRRAAELFQRHVRASKYAPFNAVTHEGHWRQLLVRTTRRGDLLLSAAFHPQELSKAELDEVRQQLRLFMTEGEGKACGATSVHWQSAGRLEAAGQRPHDLLHGDGHVTETLCGLQFRVSPDAFFQVNTAATEVLYDAIADCAALDTDTTLLDVCCGTGSIGLALAGRVRAVLGLELVPAAAADARANADRNGITNCRFFAGRAETLLRTLLEGGEAGDGRCVAVVDPPRAGLGREVTQTLRRAGAVRRVVFVACDLKQALRNLLDLARPESNQYVGYPFVVRRMVPVDLFPQTPHTEVVVLLERCDPVLWRQMEEAKASADAVGGQHGSEGGAVEKAAATMEDTKKPSDEGDDAKDVHEDPGSPIKVDGGENAPAEREESCAVLPSIAATDTKECS